MPDSNLGRSEISIYTAPNGKAELKVTLRGDTVWLNQKQMSELFEKDSDTVGRHISNIYKTDELEEPATTEHFTVVQKEGSRTVQRNVKFYSLDMIIAVGYRVNSKRGTEFRIWANKILKDHLIQGYTINQKRLLEQQGNRLKNLEAALNLLAQVPKNMRLAQNASEGIIELISNYAQTWLMLESFDEDNLPQPKLHEDTDYVLSYEEARELIDTLKSQLIKKKEAWALFGIERGNGLKQLIGAIYQTYDHSDLYPTVEEKAAHLLYFVIKDHPFTDGNKRIACFLFLTFLLKHKLIHPSIPRQYLHEDTMVALALLIAESNPNQKETLTSLVLNFIHTRTRG